MVLTSVTDRLGNAAGSAVGAVSGRLTDRVIRLGDRAQPRGQNCVYHIFGGQSAQPRANAPALGGQ